MGNYNILRLIYPNDDHTDDDVTLEIQVGNSLEFESRHIHRVSGGVLTLEDYKGKIILPKGTALDIPMADVDMNICGSIASPAHIKCEGEINLYIPESSGLKLMVEGNDNSHVIVNKKPMRGSYFSTLEKDFYLLKTGMYMQMLKRTPDPEIITQDGITEAAFIGKMHRISDVEVCIYHDLISIVNNNGLTNIYYPAGRQERQSAIKPETSETSKVKAIEGSTEDTSYSKPN